MRKTLTSVEKQRVVKFSILTVVSLVALILEFRFIPNAPGASLLGVLIGLVGVSEQFRYRK